MKSRLLAVLPQDLPGIALSEPALRSLKTYWPQIHLGAVIAPRWQALGPSLPDVDTWLPATGLNLDLLRDFNPERVFLLSNSFRDALALRRAGVPKRVGYRSRWNRYLLNRRIDELPPHLNRDRVRRMVELIGHFGCPIVDRIPQCGHSDLSGESWIVPSGLHETLPAETLQLWETAGFQRLPDDADLLPILSTAKRMIGPPDSVVTLARAWGIPAIRLVGKRVPEDDFPRRDDPKFPVTIRPDEVSGGAWSTTL